MNPETDFKDFMLLMKGRNSRIESSIVSLLNHSKQTFSYKMVVVLPEHTDFDLTSSFLDSY